MGECFVAEFDCCECGRHVIALGHAEPPRPPLCAACLMMPGWFTAPEIRKAIDPDHDGVEMVAKAGGGSQ